MEAAPLPARMPAREAHACAQGRERSACAHTHIRTYVRTVAITRTRARAHAHVRTGEIIRRHGPHKVQVPARVTEPGQLEPGTRGCARSVQIRARLMAKQSVGPPLHCVTRYSAAHSQHQPASSEFPLSRSLNSVPSPLFCVNQVPSHSQTRLNFGVLRAW